MVPSVGPKLLGLLPLASTHQGTMTIPAAIISAARSLFTSKPQPQNSSHPTTPQNTATAAPAAAEGPTTISTSASCTTPITSASGTAANITSSDGKIAFTFEEPLDYISSGGIVVDESVDADGHHERIPLHLKLAEKLDGRHFVATAAGPMADPADRVVGPGAASMADMVDVVAGAFMGERARVAKAVADLSHGAPGPSKPASPAAEWGRQEGEAAPAAEDVDVLEYCLKNRTRGGQM